MSDCAARSKAVGIRVVREVPDPELVRRVIEAYAVEKSTPVVARKLGMDSWVVRRILQHAGVEFDGGGWIVRRLNAPEPPKPTCGTRASKTAEDADSKAGRSMPHNAQPPN